MDTKTVASTLIWDYAQNTMAGMSNRRPTSDSVAMNLKWLKDLAGDNYREMARRSGVSKSAVQRILAGEQSATVEQAGALASAYGLDGWHLLLPNLPHDIAQTKTLSKLVDDYFSSSATGKIHISRVADLEARDHGHDDTGTEG